MALLGNLKGSSQVFQDTDFYNGVATQSLRFDIGSTAYLTRTPSSASNRKTFTASFWLKPSKATLNSGFFVARTGSSATYSLLAFSASDNRIRIVDNQTSYPALETSAKYRDLSAWYHMVFAVDTTQSTSSNRLKVYVNGEEQSYAATNYYSQDADTNINSTAEHYIGRNAGVANLDGYLAEYNFIDGSQLTPTSFGETKNGVWIPKEYTGSYGTNGFRLEFKNTSVGSGSSSTIGADTSGNDNHFTSNGIVASDCALADSPENNFATMNGLINGYGTNVVLTKGALKGAGTNGEYNNTFGSILMQSGKWYWEVTSNNFNNYAMIGVASLNAIQTTDSTPYGQTGVVVYATHGASYIETTSGSSAGTYASFLNQEIIGVAVDLDSSPRTVKFYNNNSLQFTENLSTNFNVDLLPIFVMGTTNIMYVNFGADSSFAAQKTAQNNSDENGIGDFYYTPPSGYLALCTENLSEPTIGPNSTSQADDHFNTILYTANGSASRAITGVGFQPDWLWVKSRSATYYHGLWDSSRTNKAALYSNTNDAEDTSTAGTLGSLDADGFTTPNVSGGGFINIGSTTYVAWNWKANGGTTTTNNDGSITSTVQVNSTSGFSIVKATSPSSGTWTVGHGLGATPDFIIQKYLASNSRWTVFHNTLTSGQYLGLNESNAVASSGTPFNFTFNSTVIGGNSNYDATSTDVIYYVFREVEGFSKFGSFTGNGSTDGTFVYTGFRPQFVIAKCSSHSSAWHIVDADIDVNPVGYLNANTTDTYQDYNHYDLLSNGFKIRDNGTESNRSGGVFVYLAFAKAPFKYANAR